MLVKDTQWIQEDSQKQAVEKHHQEVNGWIKQKLEDAYLVADPKQSIANIERQLGNPLDVRVFKNEVQTYIPDLKFKFEFLPLLNIYRHTIYHKGIFITAVDPLIPEWSVFDTREQTGVPHQHEIADTEEVPNHEISRGWRTVLVNFVARGIMNPAVAEKIAAKHGSPDRPSWAQLMGKSQQTKGVL